MLTVLCAHVGQAFCQPTRKSGQIAAASSSESTAGRPDTTAAKQPTTAAALSAWQEAVNAFKYQDFDTAITRLRALIYPKPQLKQAREWQAREYLAAALWWSGKRQLALDEFTALLVRNPPIRLDPAYYPPRMIKDFEQLRANLIRLGVIKRNQKPIVRKRPQGGLPPALGLAFFPFGVGQFANRQPLKGSLFLSAEAALAGASAALYVYNRDLGIRGQRNDTTALWQISTGGAFLAVAVWGIVDALLQRRATAATLARRAQRTIR